ncbi:hypothetical protein ACWKWP_03495 [Agromyces soli]
MIELNDIEIDEDGELSASTSLPGGREIAVLFALDDDAAPVEASEMQRIAEAALTRLTEAELDRIDGEVASELAVAIGEDAGADVDDAAVAAELELQGAIVTPEAVLVLVYEAPTLYPDMVVYCQLDDELEIVELSASQTEDDDEGGDADASASSS